MDTLINKIWLLIAMLSALLLLPNSSSASCPVHGAKASAMGTAFAAIADDPSAMASNTAGIANLKGTNIYLGDTAVILTTEYESISGETEDTQFQVFYPPHLYLSSDVGMEDLVFGVAVFSPFGIGGRKWDNDGLTRYAATESTISTFALNPNVAWRVMPNLSVGLGVYYIGSQNNAETMLDQSLLGADDAKLNLEADGDGWGYNLGVLIFPEKKFSFGFAYRSGVRVDQSGTVSIENIAPALQPLFGGSCYRTDVRTTVDFPEIVTFGIAYRPTGKLTFGLEAERVGWSSFDTMDIDYADEVPLAGFSDSSTDMDWEDSWLIKVGMDCKLNDILSLRGGYAYVETPVPEHTLNPGNPDSDQHNFSIGFGYKIRRVVIDAFYMAGFYKDRKVDNDILSGKYESLVQYIGLSMGYRF